MERFSPTPHVQRNLNEARTARDAYLRNLLPRISVLFWPKLREKAITPSLHATPR